MASNISSSNNIPALLPNLQESYDAINGVFAEYFANNHIKLGYKITADDIYNCLVELVRITLFSGRIARYIIYPLRHDTADPDHLYNEFHFGISYRYNRSGQLEQGMFQNEEGYNRVNHAIPDDQSSKLLIKVINDSRFKDEKYQTIDHLLSNLLDEFPQTRNQFNIIKETKIIGDNTRNFILQMYGYVSQLRDTIVYILDNNILSSLSSDISLTKITDIPDELRHITELSIDQHMVFFHNYSILTKDAIGNFGINETNFLYNYDYSDYANKIYVPTDHTELSGLSHTAAVNTCLGTDGCLSNYFQLSAYSEHFRAPLDEDRFHPSGRCKFRNKIIVSDDTKVNPNYRNGSWIRTQDQNRSNGAYNTGIVGLLLGLDDIVRDISNRFTGFFTNLSCDPDIINRKYRIRYYFNNSGGNIYYDDEFYPMFSLYHLKNFFDIWQRTEYGQSQSDYNGIDYYWSIHGKATYDQDFNQTKNNTIICAPTSAVAGNPTYSDRIYTLHLYPVWAIEIIYHFDYNFDSNKKYTEYVTMNKSRYNVLTVTQALNNANKHCSKPTHPYKYTWKYYTSVSNFNWETAEKNWSTYTDNKHWIAYDADKNKSDTLTGATVFSINQLKIARKVHLFPSFYVNSFTVDAGTTIIYGIRFWGELRYLDLAKSILPSGYALGSKNYYPTKAAAEKARNDVQSRAGRGGPVYSYRVGSVSGSLEIIRTIKGQVGGVKFDSAKNQWYFEIAHVEKIRTEHRDVWGYRASDGPSIKLRSGNFAGKCGHTEISKTGKKYVTIPKQEYKKTNRNKTLDDEVTWTET